MLTAIVLVLILAFVLVSVASVATASPAEAKPRHVRHSATAHTQVAAHKQVHLRRAHSRHHRGGSEAGTPSSPTPAGLASFFRGLSGGGSSSLVAIAEAYRGMTASQIGVPRSLWCADFMNLVLRRAGLPGTGSRLAKSFVHVGSPTGCRPGAIAVMNRGRGGGHVGVVKDCNGGNPIVVSGNHGHRVAEGVYPGRRIVAYRSI